MVAIRHRRAVDDAVGGPPGNGPPAPTIGSVHTRNGANTGTLVSMKGGSGKTTAAVHIAVAAAQQGRNVALIDTDPQQSAARWGDRRAADLCPP